MDLYVVEAVEVQPGKPLDEQSLEYRTYCVCDSFHTARLVIEKDTKSGDILKGRVCSHALQTEEMV